MTQVPSYLTPRQAADYLVAAGVQITEDAVRRWARDDKIPALTLPVGQYRIKREDLDAILAGDRATAAAAT